ncbi:MAG TPA: xanthine dehydrogenase family protein subunit M [Stellaceae bacterium]|nr:xanthine dehydrogenase family protein subunit M [Stellaceae bacterium]
MRDFAFLEPTSVDDACRMLATEGDEARLYAGGTALLLAMRQRLSIPSAVVYLGNVPGLDLIEFDETRGLRIGALARHADIAAHPAIRARYPFLAKMAEQVANPQIRNMGTLGGNLCYGDPSTDPPTCLLSLNATVTLRGPDGERVLKLEDFYVDYFVTALEQAEILIQVHVPPPAPDLVGAYIRFLKTPAEHRPLLGVGVTARYDQGFCRDVSIAIGASVRIPMRARTAEKFLEGNRVTAETLAECGAIAAAEINPLSDFAGSADYRQQIAQVIVRRAAARAFGIDMD